MEKYIERHVGKNTLGDGNKMKVNMRTYNRSTNDLGYMFRNTQTVGTLVPFMCEVAQRGDTWEIKLESSILTHPTVGPLFGSLKYQADIFVCPIRLYNGWLHNNKLGIGMDMSQIKLPQIEQKIYYNSDNYGDSFIKDGHRCQINPSSVLAYLGLMGWGNWAGNNQAQPQTVTKNAIPILAYWDIVKNYYSNKQESQQFYIGGEYGFIKGNVGAKNFSKLNDINISMTRGDNILVLNHNLGRALTETEINNIIINIKYGTDGTPIKYDFNYSLLEWKAIHNTTWSSDAEKLTITFVNPEAGERLTINKIENFPTEQKIENFPLKNIDDIRESIMYWNNATAYKIDENTAAPFGKLVQRTIGKDGKSWMNTKSPQYGLALKTYNSDLFNNWINKEWIDGNNGINKISAVAVTDGQFTIDSLNLAKKVYDMLNRIAMSGGSYQDWLETVYTDNYFEKTEIPLYQGGMSQEIVFQEVISNAATKEEPLGTLAGRGISPNQSKKGGYIKVKIDEPSYIIGLCSITPRVDYSQGNRFDVDLKTLNDFHKPALDNIGFEDLLEKRMRWFKDSNGIGGNSAIGKQPAWIQYKTNFNKSFGNFAAKMDEAFMVLNRDYGDGSITTYIDPRLYNHIFADTSIGAMNYWVQMRIEANTRRLISASNMPIV